MIKRWGEVSIKQQGFDKETGLTKNKFDKIKSFSIQKTRHEYTIEQLYELFTLVVDLSEKYSFDELKKKIQEFD